MCTAMLTHAHDRRGLPRPLTPPPCAPAALVCRECGGLGVVEGFDERLPCPACAAADDGPDAAERLRELLEDAEQALCGCTAERMPDAQASNVLAALELVRAAAAQLPPPPPAECPACRAPMPAAATACPACGHDQIPY